MKILHLMIANFYCDNYNYQENVLPRMHKEGGHDVKIIASTEVFVEANTLGYTTEGRYYNEDGIPVVRLPYIKGFPASVIHKLRIYKGLYDEIIDFKPDIIFCHGMQTCGLLQVVKYVKKNSGVLLYADNHADPYNSATNWLSKHFLHMFLYKQIVRTALPYIQKVLYLTYESKEFLKNMYNIKEEKMEYYPLGGTIFPDNVQLNYRKAKRKDLELDDQDIILMHSGRISSGKKTKELLKAFNSVDYPNIYLLIVGEIEKSYLNEIMPLIKENSRVKYLGWKTGKELQEYLCAADIYMQPGSQSVTMQNALCCGCAVMVTSVKSHKYLLGNAAFYADCESDIKDLLIDISKNPQLISEKRSSCYAIAKNKLNYKVLADKIIAGF
ncbi:glycosyltransferase family 4 protein [Ruminococcus gauvreauii]|uniref:glycosyltransferase family 4 protein n=1 Tax=Ruminococcus gauvreauii TaxID=438033 RepID=UPI003983FAA8